MQIQPCIQVLLGVKPHFVFSGTIVRLRETATGMAVIQANRILLLFCLLAVFDEILALQYLSYKKDNATQVPLSVSPSPTWDKMLKLQTESSMEKPANTQNFFIRVVKSNNNSPAKTTFNTTPPLPTVAEESSVLVDAQKESKSGKFLKSPSLIYNNNLQPLSKIDKFICITIFSQTFCIKKNPEKTQTTQLPKPSTDTTMPTPSPTDGTVSAPSTTDVTVPTPSTTDVTVPAPSTSDVTVPAPSTTDTSVSTLNPTNSPLITKETASQNHAACHTETIDGVTFSVTLNNSFTQSKCPAGYNGTVWRLCTQTAVWEPVTLMNCSRFNLQEANKLGEILKLSNQSARNVTDTVAKMAALFNHSLHDNPIVLAPDVTNILNGFQNIGKALTNYSQATVSDESLEKFAGISDTLMNAPNDAWLDEPEFVKTGVILHTMEQIVTSSLRSFNGTDFVLTNPSMTICRLRASGQIKFPKTGTQINSSMVGAHIYLPDIPTDVKYSVIIYHQLAQKVHLRNKEGLNILDKKMTSPIVSVSLPHVKISKPIELTFSHPGNFSRPTCAFLNTSLNGGQLGLWSTTGCVVKVSNTTHTTCSCDHLTNFGLLMSPFVPGEEIFALDIISISGCSISILSLVLNLIVYSLVWRQVKDERSVLHINLSACLLIGYIIFIAGFDRTSDVMCTVVAACLHFFFLSAVFIMLAEGINIVRMVVFVFTRTTKSFLRYLLLMSYGIPVIIVGISLGVTKTEGYGRQDSCWLSVKDGLFWAFAGPVIFVNSINGVIIVVVVVTMQRSQMIRAQSIQLKIKSALRSIGVLSPILGITWLIGVFSVNEQTIVLQYIFAIINASQGLLIFLLHCVFQRQVRDALKLWIRKRFPGEVRLTNQKGLNQNNDKTESTNYSTSQNMFDVSETKVVESHPDAEQHANMHKYENCAHLQSEKMCVQKSQENLTTEVALVENTKL